MKDFLPALVIQIVSILMSVSAVITVLSAVGLIFITDAFFWYLLAGSVPVLVVSVWYLRYKKITWQEFWEALVAAL